jgi:predicted enzyme related to lactoylglutathione lyase
MEIERCFPVAGSYGTVQSYFAHQPFHGIMKIFITSVFVDDQAKALKFYTEVLGFVKKTDISAGNYRWLTVVSPEGPADVELLLEPNENPAAKTFQKAIHDAGIPATLFKVEDIHTEYERLKKLGVTFVMKPTKTGPAVTATFDDTCGNLISITQQGG